MRRDLMRRKSYLPVRYSPWRAFVGRLRSILQHPLVVAVVSALIALLGGTAAVVKSERLNVVAVQFLNWENVAIANGWSFAPAVTVQPDLSRWILKEDCTWPKHEYKTLNEFGDTVTVQIRSYMHGRWVKGSVFQTERQAGQGRFELLPELRGVPFIDEADGLVAVGLASQEIENEDFRNEKTRAEGRAGQLAEWLHGAVREEQDHRFFKLTIGWHEDVGGRQITDEESSLQRPILIVGLFSNSLDRMSTRSIEAKVREAFESAELRSELDVTRYALFDFSAQQSPGTTSTTQPLHVNAPSH